MSDVNDSNESFVYHCFGLGETIHAIIRKYNDHGMGTVKLQQLVQKYNTLNDNNVPHLGDRVKIPISGETSD
jgi:hypothetical protein